MDTGGFIKGFHHLDQFYSEYEMSTVPEVIPEIRDRKTRTKLNSGIFEVHLRSPHPDALKRTIDFCKITGDYAALSVVDIKVMALAVSMEMEKNGTKYLKDLPNMPQFQQARPLSEATQKNFYEIPKEPINNESDDKDATDSCDTEKLEGDEQVKKNEDNEKDDDDIVPLPVDVEEGDEEEEDEEDDGEGWITPDNFTKMMMFADKPDDEDDRVFVACCTTDFAMQNVLLQMGIKLLSIDGLQIRNVRNWTLRCFACRRVSPDRNRVFCKYCGNNTLRKISIFIDSTGNVKYVNPRRQISTRGTKYSIPKPKPGRANQPNCQPIVTEFQWNKVNHEGNKKKDLDNLLDADFSFTRKKPNSRMAPNSRSNPNQVKRTTNKNKRNRRRR